MNKFTALFAFAGLAFSTTASAHVFGGQPQAGFRVDRPADDYLTGDVFLKNLVMTECGTNATTTYPVDSWVDPVVNTIIDIDAGDWCSATFNWSSDITVLGEGNDGTFQLESLDSSTTVPIPSADIPSVFLNQWSVTAGSMPGGGPRLLMDIQ